MTILRIFFISIVNVLVCATANYASESVQIVEKNGEAIIGEDTTRAQARAHALNNARRAAVEEVTGVHISGSTVVYNAQLVSDLVASLSRGVIVREEILSEALKPDGIVYTVKIKAHVKSLPQRDVGRVKILSESVSRFGSLPVGSGVVFQDNDEIQVRAKVSSDSYLHLFSIDKDGFVTKLFPNDYAPLEKIHPDWEFTFPSNSLREMGLKLRVHSAKNLSRTPETLLIVATIEKIHLLADRKELECSISELMQELVEMDSDWTEKVVGYEVRR